MRHGKLHGARQVDLMVCGLQSAAIRIENGVAHLKRIFRLGSGKALRAVLEAGISRRPLLSALLELCSLNGDFQGCLLSIF